MIKLFGGNEWLELKFWTFPGGERNVRIISPEKITKFRSFMVECIFKSSDDIIDMLLLVNAIRNIEKNTRIWLNIPYFPFARQDRVMVSGEPLALQVMVSIINSCKFDEIKILDPHSDVLAGMLDPGILKIVDQTEACRLNLLLAGITNPNTFLVSPDSGALKKIYKTAKNFNVPVVEAQKIRDVKTGDITKTFVNLVETEPRPKFIILDDICDGGRTFIELAKELRYVYGDCVIKLVVTHGIFSKGFDTLYQYIDEVYTTIRLDKE